MFYWDYVSLKLWDNERSEAVSQLFVKTRLSSLSWYIWELCISKVCFPKYWLWEEFLWLLSYVLKCHPRQGKARRRHLVYKGISVYFSLKTGKGDTPHSFTLLSLPSRKYWLYLWFWCFACTNVYFSGSAIIWTCKWRTISYAFVFTQPFILISCLAIAITYYLV